MPMNKHIQIVKSEVNSLNKYEMNYVFNGREDIEYSDNVRMNNEISGRPNKYGNILFYQLIDMTQYI